VKVKIRDNKNKLELYSDTNTVTLMTILMSFGAILIGMGAVYIGHLDSEYFPYGFGILFIFAGGALLNNSIKEHKRMKFNSGFIYLSATEKGLSLAPAIGMEKKLYSWEQVSRIVLAKLFISDSDDGTKIKNIAIIYLLGFDGTGLIERSKTQIWKTPKNNNALLISLPADQLFTIQHNLTSISQRKIKAELYSRVEFIYNKRNLSEIFQP